MYRLLPHARTQIPRGQNIHNAYIQPLTFEYADDVYVVWFEKKKKKKYRGQLYLYKFTFFFEIVKLHPLNGERAREREREGRDQSLLGRKRSCAASFRVRVVVIVDEKLLLVFIRVW